MAVVALDQALGLEAGEGEGVDELVQRHAVLQAHRDGDGEAVHNAAEGAAFLVHVDEDFAERAVLVFAGAQIDLVAADDGLLGIAAPPVRQALPPGPLLHLLRDLHRGMGRDLRRPFRRRGLDDRFPGVPRPRPRRRDLSNTVADRGWLSLEPSR